MSAIFDRAAVNPNQEGVASLAFPWALGADDSRTKSQNQVDIVIVYGNGLQSFEHSAFVTRNARPAESSVIRQAWLSHSEAVTMLAGPGSRNGSSFRAFQWG